MDVFLLCSGDGGTSLDEYVLSPDQIFAERLQARMLRLACGSLREIMKASAINLHRDTLWASLSPEHNRDASDISAEDVMEMCQLCSQISLSEIDPRLSELFSEDSDTGIRWHSVLYSMKQDPLAFSHCLIVKAPGRDATAHLFHFPRDDMFVYFELCSGSEKMLAANLLLREESMLDDDEMNSRKCKAVDLVANWILHFLWHNL